MNPTRNSFGLTDFLASLPEQLQIRVDTAVVREMAERDCFEPPVNLYAKSLDPKPKQKRNTNDLFQYLAARGYDAYESREIINRHSVVQYPTTYGLEDAARSCLGDAAAFSVMAKALNVEWLRLWKSKIQASTASDVLRATVNPMLVAFSEYDVAYIAVRTAKMAYDAISDSSFGDPFSVRVDEKIRNLMFKEAIGLSRGKRDQDTGIERTARGIDYDARRFIEATADREFEFDERMRDMIAQDADDDADEDDGYQDVAIDLEALEVARLPILSNGGRGSIYQSLMGPPMVYEEEAESLCYALSMASIANVIMWGMGFETPDDPIRSAFDASIAAVILAYGDVRTVRSRRGGGNADRLFEPSRAAMDILKLWRSIFKNPDLAYIL